MDYSRWAEMQQRPPNPSHSSDPYAHFYNTQQSSYTHHYPYYPHQPQNANPNPSLLDHRAVLKHHEIPSAQFDSGSDSGLRPPGMDSFAVMSSYAPAHVGYNGQAAAAYGLQPPQMGSLTAPTYYQDPGAATHNWVAKDAIRQFGGDPVGYAAGTRLSNGMELLVASHPNPHPIRPPRKGTWKRDPKRTKIVQSAWCEVCKVDCNSKDVLDQHKLGKKHMKNLEKLKEWTDANASNTTAAVNPVIFPMENPAIDKGRTFNAQHPTKKKAAPQSETVEDLEVKRQKVLEGGAAADAVRVCTICNVVCNSQTVFNYHLAGQKHATMVKKQVTAGP